MSTVMTVAQAIEASNFGVAIAESRYAFPIIEGIHLIALSISVGLIFLTDLRLLGVFLRHIPAVDVHKQLRPYVFGGFAIVFLSGGLLFWAEAATVMQSPPWPFKFLFILLAGLNAAYFEFVTVKRPQGRGTFALIPRGVKYAGVASIGLWTLAIICGRLVAYIPKWP